MAERRELEALGRLLLKTLIEGAKKEITEQGHVASGKGVNSLKPQLKVTSKGIVGQVLVEKYMLDLDQRQKPKFVPLKELLRWSTFVKRGVSAKERLTFSRRTQAQIGLKGIPLPGAYRFTKNGRRLNWVKFGAQRVQKELDRIVANTEAVDNILRDVIGTPTRGQRP